ncbi:cyclic nucleotide-gated ion channel 1-like isoform X2 [Argentina anserina]|uniref:cyclic nucleotide-gated ion channel 1-like isoform X2 n=1 Tax=Argentina anserina TaxID=57926 RepID=UPI0021768532|nr:cyclic nucleotide-gated ion channel 1-like isoform X2 [Potentilla anserina]
MAIHPDNSVIISITEGYMLDSKGVLQSPITPTNNGGRLILSPTKWPTFKEFFDPQGAFIAVWNKIFVISCLISVTTDPLFFYIPYINKEENCIGSDKRVGTAALVLRSLTDITFITHIIHEIRITGVPDISKRGKPGWQWRKAEILGFAKAISQKMSCLSISIIIDFIAILPIPQVAIFVFFLKVDGTEHKRKILNVCLLFQYMPKIYRIYLSSKELKQTGIWARSAFNFFLYILASHVLGAFWYFFSIQRETSCWREAFEKHTTGYKPTYYCDGQPEIQEYVILLEKHCAVNPSNATGLIDFDFGIFRNALESNSTQSTDFSKKFFYSFWWGLRNLSSLGQNLETSTYVWENCFAIVISLIGLLLFLYLIGNVQLATTKSEEIRQKMVLKELEIQLWMSRNRLPNDMKTMIIENVRHKLEENKDIHVENLLSILPRKDRRSITRLLCMDALKKVPMLRYMDESVLKMICDNLKPVIYTENSYVIRAGEPLDLMLFNTEGIIWTYTAADGSTKLGSSITKCLSKGDYYGEELLSWASLYMPFSDLPISTQNVKCHTKVEAFSLMAKDLKAVVTKLWWHFSKAVPNSNKNNSRLEELALSFLRAHRRNRSKKCKKVSPCPPQLSL